MLCNPYSHTANWCSEKHATNLLQLGTWYSIYRMNMRKSVQVMSWSLYINSCSHTIGNPHGNYTAVRALPSIHLLVSQRSPSSPSCRIPWILPFKMSWVFILNNVCTYSYLNVREAEIWISLRTKPYAPRSSIKDEWKPFEQRGVETKLKTVPWRLP